MKNLEQLNLVALDAAELQELQGGVMEGGCSPPFKWPFPFPPYNPYPLPLKIPPFNSPFPA